MKRPRSVGSLIAYLFVAAVPLVPLTASCIADDAKPANYALLVGVTTYEHAEMNKPRLEYPEADARSVGEFLAAHGYEVEYLLGKAATRKAVEAKLEQLGARGSQEGAVVLGLWGHGVEDGVTKEAMFCPYDTRIRLVKDAQGNVLNDRAGQPLLEPDPQTLVGMSRLLAGLKISGAGNRLLLADCCRETPNRPRGRAFGSSVKLNDLPDNTAAIFACSTNELAFESKDWGHGAMTKCLLDLLPQLASERDDVAAITGRLRREVQDLVAKASAGRDTQTVQPIINGVIDLQLAVTVRPVPTPMPTTSRPDAPLARGIEGSKAGEVREFGGDLKVKFCWCPPGSFTMGSPTSESGRDRDENAVTVLLTHGFWLGQTEVTQALWTSVMQAEPWKEHGETGWYQAGASYPAVYVDWESTYEFCGRLTERERAAGRLPTGWAYQLPTEAQWEYACRAGTQTTYGFADSRIRLEEFAWFEANTLVIGEKFAHEVRRKKANGWNLFDMHGNVWEWCQDRYVEKLRGGRDPVVRWEGTARARRGGSWYDLAEYCRSAHRIGSDPSRRYNDLGFRLALSPS
ncbi:MAG: SUMF1/EgtB/PvdO family nonheme iron enzyme, partial [Planctomycetaceae bacterium]